MALRFARHPVFTPGRRWSGPAPFKDTAMNPNEDRRRAPPQGVGEDPVRTLDGHKRPDEQTPPEQIPMPVAPVVGDARHPPTTQLDQDTSPAGDRGDGAHRHAEDLRQVSGVPDA